MKEKFIDKRFNKESESIIYLANTIIGEYKEQGLSLTVRQLYYQFVARGYLPNNQSMYNKLSNIINQGRLAGLVDWQAIEDRTRNLMSVSTWKNPSQIISAAVSSYALDPWENQLYYFEAWVEKEALAGVLEQACNKYRVPFFSCRGYVSQSEMWRAAKRISQQVRYGKEVIILHLGDHDPSGIDMTRDIKDRIKLLNYGDDYNISINRIALNKDQIEQHNPPPNPAKLTDTRSTDYIRKYGYSSWELDALDPNTLIELIQQQFATYIDWDLWEETFKREDEEKEKLQKIADNFK
jgi:hypothetical protein